MTISEQNWPTLHFRDALRTIQARRDGSIMALWSEKYDTLDIARLLNVRESVIYNRMTVMREAGKI